LITISPRVGGSALFLYLLATPALADEDPAVDGPVEVPEYPEVSGNVTLGLFSAAGNTESNSIRFDIETEVDYEKWRHTVTFNRHQASEDGEESAERYSGRLQSDHRITERAYLFVVGRYGRDRFGAFDRRASLAFGIGRRFIETDDVELDLEVGAGRRGAEPDGTNERDYETIHVLRGDFTWRLSDVSDFSQELEVESGDRNTSTQSVSEIRSKLAGNLSWAFSYTIEHNSDVPADSEKTDRFTAVSLQYGF
jgi:putative salt-induced outer membrane protein